MWSSIDDKLRPAQGLVTILLLLVMGITAVMLFAPPAMRTTWLVWLALP